MGSTAGIALQAGGIFASVSSQRQQAASARVQGEYAGQIADRNATLADAQSVDAIARGNESVSRLRMGTRQLVGAQRTAAAAQGIDVNSGTSADLQEDSRILSHFDELTLRNNAAREAWGYSMDAANQRTAGVNDRLAGENTAKALTAQSYSTLLTGGANLANQWRQNPPTFGGGYRSRAVEGSDGGEGGAPPTPGSSGVHLPGWLTLGWLTEHLRRLPGIQQTVNAANNIASNNYSGISIYQPKEPGK
ncbi:MAG: hypothetical protein JWM95_1051 [Gemmatimonadetes bacterium]|nr:hypothetical protein [Gemmatimonadota bacterium]